MLTFSNSQPECPKNCCSAWIGAVLRKRKHQSGFVVFADFPRMYRRVSEKTEMEGHLGCTKVVRLLLQDRDACEVVEEHYFGDGILRDRRADLFSKSYPQVRAVFSRCLERSREPIPTTSYRMLLFAQKITPFVYPRCTSKDIEQLSLESRAFLFAERKELFPEVVNFEACCATVHQAIAFLKTHTPPEQALHETLKGILRTYQEAEEELTARAVLREYLRRRSHYLSRYPMQITEWWHNFLLYHVQEYNNDQTWEHLWKHVIWKMGILSILWMGDPRLANLDSPGGETELFDAFVDLIAQFHRLSLYPEIEEKKRTMLEQDQWVQETPTQMCRLIMG